MGGYGSGRYEYASTPTVAACRALDVDEFTDAVRRPGRGFKYSWCDEHGHGDPVETIGVFVERRGSPRFTATLEDATREDVADELSKRPTHLRLRYTLDPEGKNPRERDYRVGLEYTPCPFGGVRPWFQCPAKGCGDRVGKLYRPPRGELFLCRECHGLGYQTSRTSRDELTQAVLRYRRAFAKADAKDRRPHPNSTMALVPERPGGMHDDTWREHRAEVKAAREEWNRTFDRKLRDWFGDDPPFPD